MSSSLISLNINMVCAFVKFLRIFFNVLAYKITKMPITSKKYFLIKIYYLVVKMSRPKLSERE